jgi:MFS family permease
MFALSAAQAISPAIERTKNYLFRPFKWSTYLKLATVACITEGFSSNFNFSSNHHSSSGISTSTPFNLSSGVIALIVVGILVCIAIGIFIFYLITRLRFAFFHCLAHQTKEIRPAWRLYRTQGMRYFIASLIIGLIFLFVLVLLALPFVFGFYRVYLSSQSGGQFDLASFFLLLLPFIGVAFCLCLAAYVVDLVLHDFILPHMALENLSFHQSWAVVKTRIGAEKGSFTLYIFLRAILPIAACIALFIVLVIPLLIVFGSLAFGVAGLDPALTDATGASAFILTILRALLILIGVAFGLLLSISLGGPIATWIRNYALLFYGGRYQALGDILSPPPPLPPTPGTY